ncbi:unnamed protein product [Lampetra planeri]
MTRKTARVEVGEGTDGERGDEFKGGRNGEDATAERGDVAKRAGGKAVAAESAWGRLAVTHAAAAANDDELLALLCNKRRRVGPSGRRGAVRRGGTEVARGGVPSRAIDHRHHEALSSPGPHAAAAEGRQRDGRGTVERRQRDGRVVRHVTNCPVRPLKNLGFRAGAHQPRRAEPSGTSNPLAVHMTGTNPSPFKVPPHAVSRTLGWKETKGKSLAAAARRDKAAA